MLQICDHPVKPPFEDHPECFGSAEVPDDPGAYCVICSDEQTPAHRRSSNDTPWSKARKITVPGAWEAQGVGEPGMSIPWDPLWDSSPKRINHIYMGEGWYRKDVVLPSGWAGKKVWLKIGGVKSQGWFRAMG